MRLGILVSGRGSNLEAVLDAVASGELPTVRPVLVVSNRPGVRALSVAEAHGVQSVVLRRADFPDERSRDAAIGQALTRVGAQLALLAGYDRVLHRSFFDAFAARAVNLHPSLLPRHGGRGMVGLEVHRSVLASGDSETGVTVHEVTPELDAGPALAQIRVAIVPGESAEELAKRVLELEHRLVVDVLRRLADSPFGAGPSVSMTAALPSPAGDDGPYERHQPHA